MRCPAPYTDPILSSSRLYRDLVGRLVQGNHLGFSLVRRSTVGVFTVAKKIDEQGIEWLRLMFDCRQVNWMCRAPPKARLATPWGPGISGPLLWDLVSPTAIDHTPEYCRRSTSWTPLISSFFDRSSAGLPLPRAGLGSGRAHCSGWRRYRRASGA